MSIKQIFSAISDGARVVGAGINDALDALDTFASEAELASAEMLADTLLKILNRTADDTSVENRGNWEELLKVASKIANSHSERAKEMEAVAKRCREKLSEIENNRYRDYDETYSSGALKARYTTRDGVLNGKAAGWYETGEKSWDAEFADGRLKGPLQGCYPDGDARWVAEYGAEKKLIGLEIILPSGKRLLRVVVNDGKAQLAKPLFKWSLILNAEKRQYVKKYGDNTPPFERQLGIFGCIYAQYGGAKS